MLAVSVDPAADGHRTREGHPEQPARLVAAQQGPTEVLARTGGQLLPARAAWRHELAGVHDAAYLDALADLSRAGGGELDPDTPISAGSWDTAVISAGAGLAAAEASPRAATTRRSC